jgi:pantoate kinase
MAKTPEAKVKDKIKKILETYDIYYAMPHGAGFGNAGVPDFLCCFKGKFLAIEAKANGGAVTALQIKHLNEIDKAGGVTWIINETNVYVFEAFLKINLEANKDG